MQYCTLTPSQMFMYSDCITYTVFLHMGVRLGLPINLLSFQGPNINRWVTLGNPCGDPLLAELHKECCMKLSLLLYSKF